MTEADHPTLFMLPFLAATGHQWAGVASRLAGRARCVTIDLPGFGDAHGADGLLRRRDGGGRGGRRARACAGGAGRSPATAWAARWPARWRGWRRTARRASPGWSAIVLVAGSPPCPEPMDEGGPRRHAGLVRAATSDARRAIRARALRGGQRRRRRSTRTCWNRPPGDVARMDRGCLGGLARPRQPRGLGGADRRAADARADPRRVEGRRARPRRAAPATRCRISRTAQGRGAGGRRAPAAAGAARRGGAAHRRTPRRCAEAAGRTGMQFRSGFVDVSTLCLNAFREHGGKSPSSFGRIGIHPRTLTPCVSCARASPRPFRPSWPRGPGRCGAPAGSAPPPPRASASAGRRAAPHPPPP